MREMKGFARQIIFEDKHLLVVNKLTGQFTQEASSGTKKIASRSLISEAASYLGGGGEDRGEQQRRKRYVGLVHRLDAPTSGIVILAKTREAAKVLSQDLKNRNIEKHYLAVVNGAMPLAPPQTLSQLITRPKGGMAAPTGTRTQVIPTEGVSADELKRLSDLSHVQTAELRYTPLKHIIISPPSSDRERGMEEKEGQSKTQIQTQTAVHVQLITGRKHQIRAQFSSIGHSVVGDVRYGAPQRFRKERDIALHAWAVSFAHPITRSRRMVLTAPLDNREGVVSVWTSRFGKGFPDSVNGLLRKKVEESGGE